MLERERSCIQKRFSWIADRKKQVTQSVESAGTPDTATLSIENADASYRLLGPAIMGGCPAPS